MAGIGDTLRSTREHRGLTIEQVAQDTRISVRFLEALEAEHFEELPAPVYVRGFLRSYANYLKIDPQPLLDSLVGGERLPVGGPDGFVRGPQPPPRRNNDPFQRAPVAQSERPPAEAYEDGEEDGWQPEAPVPSTATTGSGYIPGSDLIEDPEYPAAYAPEEPRFRPRSAGILLERPPREVEGGPGTRLVAITALAVLGVLAIIALGVFALGGDDGGNVPAGGGTDGGETPGITPTNVIPVGTETATASALPSGTTSTTPAASQTGTVTATTTPGTPTPSPTAGARTPTATATVTPTPSATSTPAPTSTPTPLPTPTPVPTPEIPPHPSTYSACDINAPVNKCGSSTVRIICFPPFAETAPSGRNDNYFVDVTKAYPLQPGWREIYVEAPTSLGPVIDAGRRGCN